MEISGLVRQARQRAGITQVELADRLGKSQPTVATLERPGANPRLSTLSDALHALGHRLELRAVPHRSSVDDTLVAGNLRLTPAERLANFEAAHRELEGLRGLAWDRDGEAR
jgi:transcriptional regulator with XRE-family HTH domain